MSAGTEEKSESSPASAPAAASSGGGGGNKLVLILTAFNLVVTIGMVAVLFISFQKDKKQPSVTDIDPNAESAHAEGAKEGEGHGGGHGEAKEGKGHDARKNADFGKMVTLDQFTVNLSTPGAANPKFVRVNVSLEVPNEDSEAEVNAKIPQIRNVIIDLFNSKRPGDLANADGRDFLKEEIKNALNGFLVHGKIRGVFFTNFALSS